MNLSAPFIRRPVATTLLTLGVAIAGMIAFPLLPVAPLPPMDIPTITVQATMPGASPEVMASSVATPLERHLGEIADVTEMTSTSQVNSTRVVLQFGLDRDIDGAARDVQAAIVAARADLPTSLRSNPTYRKVNPATAPILILAMTSPTLTQGQLYDSAATVLQQKLSQVAGIGQVNVSGSSLPAVRVELNPQALFKYGIGLEDVRAALAAANANAPKGAIDDGGKRLQIYTNDQARTAASYRPLVIAYRNGAAVRLSDMAEVDDSVEDLRNYGLLNDKPAVLVILFPQPGANIIETVDRVKALLPELQASLPSNVELTAANDRSTTIRASLKQVETALVIAVCLVVLVVFIFLGSWRGTLIPAVAVPVSLIGTVGAMYLLGFSLDNFSLMALTVATGFVVDDAIVVMENISRHIEAGVPRMQAALQGAREVGFTVLSMSLSLVAVFLPILLMGGLVGRLFHEFAITLSLSILISLVISLTTTPMMCSRFLATGMNVPQSRWFELSERGFAALRAFYGRTLAWALKHRRITLLILFVTVLLNVALYVVIPKGFFPQQDTGRLMGGMRADQSISFQAMKEKLTQFVQVIREDPAVDSVVGYMGGGGFGGGSNSASVNVALKPLSERHQSAIEVIGRLRGKLTRFAGAQLFLQPVQDIPAGGRQSNSQYQYTLQGDDLTEVKSWATKLAAALRNVPELTDVDTDQQTGGLETELKVDRDTASRLHLQQSQIDNTLYDAFGQRQVSVIYNPLNQYHVVMEVAPRYWQSPETLRDIYVSTAGGSPSGTQSSNAVAGTTVLSNGTARGNTTAAPTAAQVALDAARNLNANQLANTGHGAASTGAAVSASAETMIPLSAFSRYGTGSTQIAVNHQGSFVATTISFNLAPGVALGTATNLIHDTMNQIGVPATIQGSFGGTAKFFQASLSAEPLLIVAAIATIYIVLGMLYESYIHPITILSTLPSAGVGALIALMITGNEFSIIAIIGVFLLIGIVKKNAIMMIDFAIDAERTQGLDPYDAILQACLLRLRPILMTTCAAIFGALPLALAYGDGTEMRRPLGVSIVGGLLVSQLLTLYTTPVVYLYLDRAHIWWKNRSARRRDARGLGRPSEAGL